MKESDMICVPDERHSECDIQAFIHSNLDQMEYQVRSEYPLPGKKGWKRRCDLAVFHGGRLVRLVEVKKGKPAALSHLDKIDYAEFGYGAAVRDMEQTDEYAHRASTPCDLICGLDEAVRYLKVVDVNGFVERAHRVGQGDSRRWLDLKMRSCAKPISIPFEIGRFSCERHVERRFRSGEITEKQFVRASNRIDRHFGPLSSEEVQMFTEYLWNRFPPSGCKLEA